MRKTTAAEIARLVSVAMPCRLVGDDRTVVGPDVVRDNREATKESLFVALVGEKFDGHDFASKAVEAGSSVILSNRATDADATHVICPDTLVGLSGLARGLVAREIERGLTTFAITGSSGKTSTKDLLAQILEHSASGNVVSPQGSYNNEIGVPLTACQVDEATQYFVAEMGADAKGDVAKLCQIVPPKISMIINIGMAHLGKFGSREAIAEAKSEIFEALPQDGWAVLNADDDLISKMRPNANLAAFSIRELPDYEIAVSVEDVECDDYDRYSFTLVTSVRGDIQRHPVKLKVLGKAQMIDAAAAATAALAAGLAPEKIAEGLSIAEARSSWRMALTELSDDIAIINDAYNANPGSMAAALNSLSGMGSRNGRQRRTIAILGDMLELGDKSYDLHRNVGRMAAELGITKVYAVGEFAPYISEGVTKAGGSAEVADPAKIAEILELSAGDIVLVKASRGLALEKVADRLTERFSN